MWERSFEADRTVGLVLMQNEEKKRRTCTLGSSTVLFLRGEGSGLRVLAVRGDEDASFASEDSRRLGKKKKRKQTNGSSGRSSVDRNVA